MDTYKQNCKFKVYEVDGHSISIDATLAKEFSDVVCPITEPFLRFQIKVFGKDNVNDDILSKKISLDMTQELRGYHIQ